MSHNQKIKVIYILSSRYSGSTLVSFLLGHHPDIATIGERRKFVQKTHGGNQTGVNCSCGKNFQECEMWMGIYNDLKSEIGERAFIPDFTFRYLSNKYFVNKALKKINEVLFTLNLGGLFSLLWWNKKNMTYNLKLIKKILKYTDKTVFLDSSKLNDDIPFYLYDRNIDFRIIYLYKKPIAQIASNMKHNRVSLDTGIEEFLNENLKYLNILNKNSVKYIKVSYEELCVNTENTLKKILLWADLSDANLLRLAKNPITMHLMGNALLRNIPFEGIRLDEKWRERLSNLEKKEILKRTEFIQPLLESVEENES